MSPTSAEKHVLSLGRCCGCSCFCFSFCFFSLVSISVYFLLYGICTACCTVSERVDGWMGGWVGGWVINVLRLPLGRCAAGCVNKNVADLQTLLLLLSLMTLMNGPC